MNSHLISKKRERNFIELAIEKEEFKQRQKIQQRTEPEKEEKPHKDLNINNLNQNLLNLKEKKNYFDHLSQNNKDIFGESEAKYTLKININKTKEQKVKELLKNKNFYVGGSGKTRVTKREKMMKKGFNFIEVGSFAKVAKNALANGKKKENNAKEYPDKTAAESTSDNKDTKNDALTPLLSIKPRFTQKPLELKAENFIPDCESWDQEFLPSQLKSFIPGELSSKKPQLEEFINYIKNPEITSVLFSKVNFYIHHPVEVKNELLEKNNKVSLPVFLTAQERKRAKRLRRIQKQEEEQNLVKLGLAEPKKPKLTFKNFMNIFQDETVTDPSQIEQKVKKAYEERYNKMIKENEKKKLTKEQKREKLRRKFERDSKKECCGCLFVINTLKSNKNRFKIDKNAQQLYLTGTCLMNRNGNTKNYLYVEGGPLAVKKMKILIQRRIKWDETETEKGKEDENKMKIDDPNHTKIIWEGTLKKRNCEDWKMQEIQTEGDAIQILKQKGMDGLFKVIDQME